MPTTIVLQDALPETSPGLPSVSAAEVVTAGIPYRDNCPIMRRVKAFLVKEGTRPILEHVLRDRQGRPLDLTGNSSSSDSLFSLSAGDTVLVRIREFMDGGDREAHTWRIEADITTPESGIVRARVPQYFGGQSGIYQASWAYVREGQPLWIDNTLISVEPTLFGEGNAIKPHSAGCPTINEIRMQLWDSDPAENLLLDDVEFGDEQIVTAIVKPIQYFNETNPPLSIRYNTTNFPFRSHWIDAAIGHLYGFAAAFYRRNRLQGAAGGINIDDLGKEGNYMQAAQLHRQAWEDFVIRKKVEINAMSMVGSIGSSYLGY